MGEEEIITDPVLKAIRKFDEEHLNKISLGLLRDIFDAMKEDELGVGTHVFYGDITNDELEWAKGAMQELGNEVDVTYEDLKRFIEAQDVADAAGRPPGNLVSTIMSRRMDGWFDSGEVTALFSPRSWRMKLEDANADGGTSKKDKKKKNDEPVDEEADQEQMSPRNTDKKDKKDKKEKKAKEEKDDDEKKDKKDKKEKKEDKGDDKE